MVALILGPCGSGERTGSVDEQSNVRFIGVAKGQIQQLTKVRTFRKRLGARVLAEVEDAYAYTQLSYTVAQDVLQSRPEYQELKKSHRERAKSTKVYRGKTCKMYWFEDRLESGERLMIIWAIVEVEKPRSGLMDLFVSDV